MLLLENEEINTKSNSQLNKLHNVRNSFSEKMQQNYVGINNTLDSSGMSAR